MNIDQSTMTINGLSVAVVRKSIKNLHIGVYPPHGRVRVAAPNAMNDDAVRLAVIDRLRWIKRQQDRFESQPRQSKRELVDGESVYVFGCRYLLHVIEHNAPGKIELRNHTKLDLYVRTGSSTEQRRKVLTEWYRRELKTKAQPLIDQWQSKMDVQITSWGVKQMKTKWGSCNTKAHRIWLNLELAKKPLKCLEYVIVHELTHLLERNHNDKFVAYMDKFLPQWRNHREELNRHVLEDAEWKEEVEKSTGDIF